MLERSKVFEGLKVVELASVLAGPSVGMFFAELGATVIKYENKRAGGDMTRFWKNSAESKSSPISAYYASINFFKRVHQVDLKNSEDLEKVLEDISSSDVVLTNFKKGSAERLGLDYPAIKSLNSKLIYAEIEGMGPGDNRPAFDVVLQAETGFISMTGNSNDHLAKMPVALIDVLAAHQLKEGILIALMKRATTGKGCRVVVSLLDSGLASLVNQASNYLMSGHAPSPMGTLHPNISPYGDLYNTANGISFVLAVGTEGQWKELVDMLDLKGEIVFYSNEERVKNRMEVDKVLRTVFLEWESDVLFPSMRARNIPYGRVLKVSESLESPQAQDLVIREFQEGVEKIGIRSVVFRFENE